MLGAPISGQAGAARRHQAWPLGFNIADFGARKTAQMKATKVMTRRLPAVMHAGQSNSDWEVAQRLEENAAGNLAPESITRPP